ncbi:hypothetical protein AAG570_008361 [Ranatra chinensis]|uniref:PI3K/PI4K catalytic domain-containing protein n=1 Tax=Ranatra chinensis TaxID=642074 RepID=A0ABD0YBJ5_9HEMI
MSIVGYVVGLGDRHGENILLDTTCGDGECFKIPEIVPFRLTHNMVKAMGPTGTEGSFVHSCQITNRILRSHKDELLAVITPFSYESELKRKPSATTFGPEDYTDAQVRVPFKI